MKKKKPYTFTLNVDLMKWFKDYAGVEDRSMSSLLNSYILKLKRRNNIGDIPAPTNVLKVKRDI
jgi:hypothetical protein|tara:strand:- start:2544 stop:2735 length:192 start_codon:yes stop_codon:yes gene_type:complete